MAIYTPEAQADRDRANGLVTEARIRQVVEVLRANSIPPRSDGSYLTWVNRELFELSKARAQVLRAKAQTARRGVPRRGLRSAIWWVKMCKDFAAATIQPKPRLP